MATLAKFKLLQDYEDDTRRSFWKQAALRLVVGLATVFGLVLVGRTRDTLGAILTGVALLVHTALIWSTAYAWGVTTTTIDNFKIATLEGDDD